MNAPDYSGTAVTIHVDEGFGEGFWRNSCPVDCGWHGSDWTDRAGATEALNGEKGWHQCLRTAREAERADD